MGEYDIFLSHAEEDVEITKLIIDSIDALNLDMYVDETEGDYGEDLLKSLKHAIEECEFFVVVLTDNALKSQWVNQEIGFAEACEDVKILPIRMKGENVKGFLSNIKGIPLAKKEFYDYELVVNHLVAYLADAFELEYFYVECVRCGERHECEFPEREDIYLYTTKKIPMTLECVGCGHINEIRPTTFTLIL